MTEKALIQKASDFDGALPGSLELAYLGDTVYDLYVRTRRARVGGRVKEMHARAIQLVCASAQADALTRVEAMLTEGEAAVVRRARNAKQTPAKNADAAQYHRATSLEALLGYLYLTSQADRLDEIMLRALDGAIQ
ncbi:MAG: ribonuclease III domain-containing protein [Clostridia bacterium]